MAIAFIDQQVRKNCWNFIDSYGEICVHCGCCAIDKKTRYKSRLKCLKRWLKEREEFDDWDDHPGMRELQEKNIKSDIQYFKRKIRYYKQCLKKMAV